MGEASEVEGRSVPVADTRLWVLELGAGYPVLVLHGGPGMDHTYLRPWLDPLAEWFRLVYVDQRSQGRSDLAPEKTLWTDQLVADVDGLAAALGLDRYALLGHSFGASIALRHAVDRGSAAQYVLSGVVPSPRWLDSVDDRLAEIEPPEVRDRIDAAWRREPKVKTIQEFRQVLEDQIPFHFKDPIGEAQETYRQAIRSAQLSPFVLRTFARRGFDPIDVEDRLGFVPRPVLVIAARHDRVASTDAGRWVAEHVARGELVVLENSGHMAFAEEPEAFREAVVRFLERRNDEPGGSVGQGRKGGGG